MKKSYGFRYTSDDEGESLYRLFSIGHGVADSEAYRWNGLERMGQGLIFQYTLKGAGKLRAGGTFHSVPKGHAFLARIPGDHEYSFDRDLSEEWEFLWIRFEGMGEEWLGRIMAGLSGPVLEIPPDSDPIRLLWQLLGDMTGGSRIGDKFELSLRIYEWWVSLQRAYLSRSKGVDKGRDIPEAFRKVGEYMGTHYGEDLTLDQLAEVAGMNKYHLCKMFPLYYGATPMDYVRNRRMERAAELLRVTQLPVSDIAIRCGYGNVSYFGKVFHKMVGMSPSSFREAEAWQVQDHLRLLE